MGAQGDPSVLSPRPLALQGFYDQVANPLLVDVELQYPQDTVSALTQHSHKQFYEGSEIVVAGRIVDNKLNSFKADMQAHGVNTGLRMVERPDSSQRLPALAVPHPCPHRGPVFPHSSAPTTAPCHTHTPGLTVPSHRSPRDRLGWGQHGLD